MSNEFGILLNLTDCLDFAFLKIFFLQERTLFSASELTHTSLDADQVMTFWPDKPQTKPLK